jgi:glutathionylspermidine synthase
MLDSPKFEKIRRAMVLDHCKWDPQVGDVGTLAPFPLILRESTWRRLARSAEALAAEMSAAEAELIDRPELHRILGLPRSVRRVLASARREGLTPGIARVIRFDFHPTTEGWRISEANSDVPGGFTEASSFARMMAAHSPAALRIAGDPATRWAEALAHGVRSEASVALLVAPGYMEDQQVVQFLARQLRDRGLRPRICNPGQLRWRDGRAYFETEASRLPIDAIVRFYQGEWLAGLPARCGWPPLFCGGATPVCNPGSALLGESKRFPLVWRHLTTRLPTWRSLLPETRDPREVNWAHDDTWLLKAAYCNNGDEVVIRHSLPPMQWRKAARRVRWNPGGWVAQWRFEGISIPTPLGPMQPCIGVYTVDGRAAGIYGRLTGAAVIDYSAIDVAVLVEEGEEGEVHTPPPEYRRRENWPGVERIREVEN